MNNSLIVKVVSQKMVPFIIMLGASIILHGAATPGGGFQGGVVIGAAYILFALGIDAKTARLRLPVIKVKIVESAGVLIYAFTGLGGILLGSNFLANKIVLFPPQGEPGGLFGGGTLIPITIGVGIHVACTVASLYYAFVEYEGEPKPDKETE
ncbi:MAG: MnhB domain-containing protein [Candidatus Schekmanbacteria bacterium]|nr:MnhB domain-containing protein [Candidatus Schekmanbacteria bacterium]